MCTHVSYILVINFLNCVLDSQKIKYVEFIIFIRSGQNACVTELDNKHPDLYDNVTEKNGLLWEYTNHDVQYRVSTYVIYRIKYVLKTGKVRITPTRYACVGMRRSQYEVVSHEADFVSVSTN